MGSVQLVHGDMFSGPCDLIVLPASTLGSTTRFVQERLREYDIKRPEPGPLGAVHVLPFDGAQTYAQQVAWAVSVHRGRSSLHHIEQIGRRLGEATTTEPYPQKTSAPLLGTGAGRLDPEDVLDRLTAGFLSTAAACRPRPSRCRQPANRCRHPATPRRNACTRAPSRCGPSSATTPTAPRSSTG